VSCNGARFEPLYELRPANQALVDRHQGDRYKKKFLYWDHLHTRQVRRTTLADANERRDPRIFEELTRALMAQAGNAIRKAAGALKDSLWEILTELRTGLFLRVQQEQERWRRSRQRQATIDAVQRRLFT
jgi:hypothetical protein